MPTEKEKATNQIKTLEDFLPNEKKEGLVKILAFGEKYKKEGDEMEGKFWKEHNRDEYNRDEFLNLISQYEESKQIFIKKLPEEEREVLDNLKGISREKFYKEYLWERIIYGGNLERKSFDYYNNMIEFSGKKDEIIEKVKDVKGEFKPGMDIFLGWNNIGEEGVKVLAEEWKNSLQPGMGIDLGENNIGDEGVKVLAKEWKDSLQPGMKIGLRGNNIGDEGAQAIMDNLKLKDGVELNLVSNNISDEKKEELKAWAKSYKNRGINCEVNI